ncbi:hypothetical protein E4U55_003594 [Claviceps digitariae]|nr:hypothetical protein E4U55_003594 [Claviceps digitariae]
MVRLTLPRASKLAANPVDHGSEHSRPFKTFIRRVDKNNNVYYTLAKQGLGRDSPNPDKEYEFFEMPDLLLHLDAQGATHVRPVDDGDEAALMTAKWEKVPQREAAGIRLKELEAQLAESRDKVHAILSQPANIWRITPHDVVSAALHGGSAAQRTTADILGLFNSRQATDAKRMEARQPWGGSDIIDKIRVENGIPPHAADDDQLLLQWMILRYKKYKKSPQQQPLATLMTYGAFPMSAMMKVLEAQSSVTGIRRLVFMYLNAGTNAVGTQPKVKLDARLCQGIRDACERVLPEVSFTPEIRQILTFLGNLSEQQLASVDAHLGTVLCGLALKLAARIGSLEATSMWLRRCYQRKLGLLSREEELLLLKDVVSTLDNLRSMLNSDNGFAMMHEAKQRQLLFQFLTGLDKNNALTPGSMMSLVRSLCLDEPISDAPKLLRQVYTGYLRTLGCLGAVRTIWKEWRHIYPPGAAPPTISLSGDQDDDGLVRAFAAALQRAIHVTSASGGKIPAGAASLEECVTADYHAIEMQEPHSWRTDMYDDNAEKKRIPGTKTCRSTLDLPLEECIASIQSW